MVAGIVAAAVRELEAAMASSARASCGADDGSILDGSTGGRRSGAGVPRVGARVVPSALGQGERLTERSSKGG